MPAFDAYYKWLSIPPDEQPPNHYRLLGVPLLESDLDVIEANVHNSPFKVIPLASPVSDGGRTPKSLDPVQFRGTFGAC